MEVNKKLENKRKNSMEIKMKNKKCYICGKKSTIKTKYFIEDTVCVKQITLCKKHYEYVTIIKICKGFDYIEEKDLNFLKEELE